MERSPPVRKPHTSDNDLLTWSDNPANRAAADSATPGSRRSNKVQCISLALVSFLFSFCCFFVFGNVRLKRLFLFFGFWFFSPRVGSVRWCLEARWARRRQRRCLKGEICWGFRVSVRFVGVFDIKRWSWCVKNFILQRICRRLVTCSLNIFVFCLLHLIWLGFWLIHVNFKKIVSVFCLRWCFN